MVKVFSGSLEHHAEEDGKNNARTQPSFILFAIGKGSEREVIAVSHLVTLVFV